MALPSNDQAQRIAPTADLNRIVVVGSTGSGKTTLARALSGTLGSPHIELDALHWVRTGRLLQLRRFASVCATPWLRSAG